MTITQAIALLCVIFVFLASPVLALTIVLLLAPRRGDVFDYIERDDGGNHREG